MITRASLTWLCCAYVKCRHFAAILCVVGKLGQPDGKVENLELPLTLPRGCYTSVCVKSGMPDRSRESSQDYIASKCETERERKTEMSPLLTKFISWS